MCQSFAGGSAISPYGTENCSTCLVDRLIVHSVGRGPLRSHAVVLGDRPVVDRVDVRAVDGHALVGVERVVGPHELGLELLWVSRGLRYGGGSRGRRGGGCPTVNGVGRQ
jgi:hypothetical protein